MRVLSYLLFALAAFVAGGAVLIYRFVQNMACGYASGSSACHARPWELEGADRFWLVSLPLLIVGALIAGGMILRRKASQRRR